MTSFTSLLRLEHIGGAAWRSWRLLEPLTWDAGGEIITVPAGFETDGATVPGILWPFFPMTGRYLRAAVLHDYLCALLKAGRPHHHAMTRKDADRKFLAAMRVVGVERPRRWVLYLAVRAFSIIKGL